VSWSGELAAPVDELADQPDVVLDHPVEQVHRSHLPVGGDAQAPGRVEVHLARGGQPERRRPGLPPRRREPEGPPERASERLVAGVAGLHRDPQDVVVGGDELVRRSLEQDASTQRRGGLTSRG
jgi:hypothetical protein